MDSSAQPSTLHPHHADAPAPDPTLQPSTPSPSDAPSIALHGSASVLDKLAALELKRRAERDKKREDARALADPRESVQQFLDLFSQQQQGVDAAVAQLLQAGPQEGDASKAVQQQLDQLSSEVLQMESATANASYYLPAYDQKQCTVAVTDLRSKIDTARTSLVPKRKFAFSKKVSRVKGEEMSTSASGPATAAGTAPPDQAVAAADANAAAHAHTSSSSTDLPAAAPSERDMALVRAGHGLMGLRNQTVVRTVLELDGQDFVLIDLEGCTVYLLGQLPALRALRLRDTRVIAGPVTGACFVDDLRGCTMVLASYQVRIHRTQQTDFYLRVRSNPIIEHSHGVRFAPYILEDLGVLALMACHRLGEETGCWCQVDDFGWIKATQSPNWSVLPAGERLGPLAVPPELMMGVAPDEI